MLYINSDIFYSDIFYYKDIQNISYEQDDNLNELFANSDVISMHVHVTSETIKMINHDVLALMKTDALLVNY